MKKVLVVVDMQNDFIDGSLGTKEAQEIVPNVVNKIKEWDGDIILVEGIVDSLVYPNSIPLMGKQLYKDSRLYDMLHQKSNGNIYICLDSDTDISETKRIYKLLNKGRLKNRIRYIRMDKYKDFGEIYESEGKQGLINAISKSKQFTNFELIF